jgi:hypothetical protein
MAYSLTLWLARLAGYSPEKPSKCDVGHTWTKKAEQSCRTTRKGDQAMRDLKACSRSIVRVLLFVAAVLFACGATIAQAQVQGYVVKPYRHMLQQGKLPHLRHEVWPLRQ